MDESLGRRVRRLRNQVDMRAAELARRAGVSKSTISGLENNRVDDTTSDRLRRIAEVLGVTSDELRMGTGRAAMPVLPQLTPDATIAGGGGTPPSRPADDPDLTQMPGAVVLGPGTILPVIDFYIPAGGMLPADLPTIVYPLPLPKGDPDRYVAIPVRGDCMEPRIPDGAYAVVDREASARVGDVCVLWNDGEWTLKRLREAQDGLWTFGADNPSYPTLIHIRTAEARIQGVVMGTVAVGAKP